MKYLYILLLIVYCSSSQAASVCTLNSSDEVTNTSDCNLDAEKYVVYLYNIGLCRQLPSYGDLGSCSFWDTPEGDFVITPTAQSGLIPTSELPAGTYGWVIAIFSPTVKITATASFNSARNGANGSAGKKCWTNGSIVNLYQLDTSVNTNWTADCGASLPSATPPNIYTYDSFSRHSFVNTGTVTHPSGTQETLYLTKSDYSQALSSSDVERLVSITPISTPIQISNFPVDNKFTLNFDRSTGAHWNFNNSLNVYEVRLGSVEATFTRQ